MRVLLVYVNVTARRFFPTNITTLAGFLRQNGHDIDIFDTSFYKEAIIMQPRRKKEEAGIYKPIKNPIPTKFNKTSLFDDFREKVEKFKPKLIGLSSMSIEYPLAIKIAKYAKENFSNILIIMGGIHPTIAPDEVISNKFVDIVCIGEGELALNELCNQLDSGKEITSINNLWIKHNGKISNPPTRDFVNLNQLPIPDWSSFNSQHIFGELDGRVWKMVPVESSRGCPYSCTYCINHILQKLSDKTGKKFHRRKTVEKWIIELKYLKEKYDIEMFYILDETFLVIPMEELKELVELYKKEVNIPFFIQTMPLSVTEEKVRLLKEMGCYLVTIGIENGNPEIRAKILNRPMSDETIIKAFRLFKKYKIKASSYSMVGVPFETRDDFFKTVILNRKCKPDTLAVSIFIPYKGTKLRQIAIENGFLQPSNEEVYPTDFTLLNMPQFRPETIHGLFRTFALYCGLPKIFFPLIRIAEKENKVARLIYKFLFKMKSVSRKEER